MKKEEIKSPEHYSRICLIINLIYWGLYIVPPIICEITNNNAWAAIGMANMFFLTIPYIITLFITHSMIAPAKKKYAEYVVKRATHQI